MVNTLAVTMSNSIYKLLKVFARLTFFKSPVMNLYDAIQMISEKNKDLEKPKIKVELVIQRLLLVNTKKACKY